MLTAEARIETDRPNRYLVQLCRHVNGIYSKGGPLRHRRDRHLADDAKERGEAPPHVEWSETRGSVTFGAGKITMQASPGALLLRAESADEESLRRVQDLVTGLLARFSRRDHLTVDWRRREMPA